MTIDIAAQQEDRLLELQSDPVYLVPVPSSLIGALPRNIEDSVLRNCGSVLGENYPISQSHAEYSQDPLKSIHRLPFPKGLKIALVSMFVFFFVSQHLFQDLELSWRIPSDSTRDELATFQMVLTVSYLLTGFLIFFFLPAVIFSGLALLSCWSNKGTAIAELVVLPFCGFYMISMGAFMCYLTPFSYYYFFAGLLFLFALLLCIPFILNIVYLRNNHKHTMRMILEMKFAPIGQC